MTNDPFSASLDQINSLITELLNKYSSLRTPQPSVSDDDPQILDYLSTTYGGARGLAELYSSAQPAGLGTRGAYNKAGGSISQSEAQLNALKALAAQYASKYSEAIKYASSKREADDRERKDTLTSLNDLIANRNKLVAAQNDWLASSDQLQFNREQASFANDLATQENRRQVEQFNADSERRNAQRDEQLALENRWKSLAAKARLVSRIGKTAAGWTNSDDLLSERLGVQLGYYEPWQRRLEVRMSAANRRK